MKVNLKLSSINLIHTEIRIIRDCDWIQASWMYGNPYRAENDDFWNWDIDVIQLPDQLWFYKGDLNEYLWDFEKLERRDGSHTRPRYLQDFMSNLGLIDLGFCDPRFTWRGTRNNQLAQERLDRGLIYGHWQELWPHTNVIHKTVRGSDHCLLIVSTKRARPRGKPIFLFEALWVKDNNCRDVVERS